MGFIRDSFGRVCVESRRESFILHVDHGGAPGPSPEFLTADLDDVIAALSDYRASLPAAARAAATPDPPTSDEFTEAAWGLIANAYGGNWSEAPDEWHGAAARWRDEYVAGAVAAPPAASPDERLRSALAAADRPQPPADERLREALDNLLAAVTDVERCGEAGLIEALDDAMNDAADLLAAADRDSGDVAIERLGNAVIEANRRGPIPPVSDDPDFLAADREKPDADMQAAMDRADEELRAELDAPLVSDDPVPDPETNT